MHNNSLKWLESNLRNSIAVKNIVVTHHTPSIKSIPDEFKEDFVSSAYASNLESFILEHKPNYWIHGHIHQPVNYKIGDTRIICNPRGYCNEKYNGYNPKLIIEV